MSGRLIRLDPTEPRPKFSPNSRLRCFPITTTGRGHRQGECEFRAFPDLGICGDAPAVTLDDALND